MEPTTGADEGMMQLVSTGPLPYIGQTPKSITFRANEQLIDRKRSGHCVHLVLRKVPHL
jgi:hypothetical protein